MSLHNLLELDNLSQTSQPEKPRPKPRIQKVAEIRSSPVKYRRDRDSSSNEPSLLPRPKPRRRRRNNKEHDVDDALSLSSISSEGGDRAHRDNDNVLRTAYDNPMFISDDGGDDDDKRRVRKTPPTREKESTKDNDSRIRRYSAADEENPAVYKKFGWGNTDDDSDLDDAERKLSPQTRKSRRAGTTEILEKSPLGSVKSPGSSRKGKKKRQEEIDGEKKESTSPEKKVTPTKSTAATIESSPSTLRKPKIGKFFQRLLSRGNSKTQSQQSEEKVEVSPKSPEKKEAVKTVKSSPIIKKSTTTSKPSESSTPSISDDEDDDIMEIDHFEKKNIEKLSPKPEAKKVPKIQEKIAVLPQKEKGKKKLLPLSLSKSPKRIEEFLPKSKPRSHSHHLVIEDKDGKDEQSFDEEKEITRIIKPPKPIRRGNILKQQRHKDDNEDVVTSGSGNIPEFLGITIHNSDQLPLDENALHPLVKVTMMTQEGKLIKRREENWWIKPEVRRTSHQHQHQHSKRKGQDSILPIMTQPYNFQLKSGSINPTLAPKWNELLLFEEPFHSFLKEHPNLIIFFEVMDFLPMNYGQGQLFTDEKHGTEAGWYKLCWAFLKPTGANGDLHISNCKRLQLFKPLKLRRNEVRHDGPEVFSWWKCGRRKKLLNTTLYITVKGVSPPLPLSASTSASDLRQLLSLRKEQLTDAVIESHLKSERKGRKNKASSMSLSGTKDLRRMINWSRLEGQSCKVPNHLLESLPKSPIESLNLTISGNVHCLKFSPCGLKLAAGLDTDDLHAVLIFEIPSGSLLRSLKHHHGLIYELSWTEFDLSDNLTIQYLASASADSTVCLWKMQNGDDSSLQLINVLHHPSFVYTVQFHPANAKIVATGCFDFIIRIWQIDDSPSEKKKKKQRSEGKGVDDVHLASPLFKLDRHPSFVNSLIFDSTGAYMFSGDGDGCVLRWNVKVPAVTKAKSWTVERETRMTESGKIPVNCLSLHPNGIRLLVHLRDNCLKILDASSFLVLNTIRGLTNDRLQIRSCFSPCGNLIISGNEDSSYCIWDSDTYSILDIKSPKNHPHCFITSVDYHPHDFYLAVGLASAISEPNPVLLYSYNSPNLKQIAIVQSGVAKFKANLAKARSQKTVSFKSRREDSSEKFMSIIDKLDEALQDARRRRSRQELMQITENAESQSDSKSKGDMIEGGGVIREIPERLPAKSPRSYIEGRLEELIIPKQGSRTHSSKSKLIEEHQDKDKANTKKRNMREVHSPKNLPKPVRQRSNSSTTIDEHASFSNSKSGPSSL